MTLPLTERQEQLWRFIRSCDRSPSFVEMQRALGLASKSGVHRLIESLSAKGYVSYIRGRARSIVALEPVPVIGPNLGLASVTTAALTAECYRRGMGIVMIPLHGRIA